MIMGKRRRYYEAFPEHFGIILILRVSFDTKFMEPIFLQNCKVLQNGWECLLVGTVLATLCNLTHNSISEFSKIYGSMDGSVVFLFLYVIWEKCMVCTHVCMHTYTHTTKCISKWIWGFISLHGDKGLPKSQLFLAGMWWEAMNLKTPGLENEINHNAWSWQE